ncbi:MAG TPA: phage holin family protein [Verrucomicrobiae bacterium]|jgi:uncharacterized membrane protein YqjE|nr:phage holin family protein [Verrucomicrobiae bacterium]
MTDSSGSPSGLMNSLRRLLETFVAILESRVELAGVEWREERARAIVIVILALALAFAGAMFAVILTTLLLVLFWSHAIWALSSFALFYALAGLATWRVMQSFLKKPFFAETISQLKKDRAWLIPRN